MKQTLMEIEQNIASRKETDKVMWFSMWAVLSVASFGIAWFLMIYYLIKRRNAHFSRQEKLEALILSKLKKTNTAKLALDSSSTENQGHSRNVAAWTLSTLLVLPAFYVFYFLKSDLRKHEEHEHDFLAEVIGLAKESDVSLNIHGFAATPSFPSGKYIALSVLTFGLAAAYWLYRIFNDYNSHFKRQWKIEDELLRFLKAIDNSS